MKEDEEDAPALPAAKGTRVPAGRRAVVEKLWRAARRQLAAHEARLVDLPKGTAASEADAKTLATLARTVRELLALDADAALKPAGGAATDGADTADGSRQLAELRRQLARRLERIAAGGPGAGDAPADPLDDVAGTGGRPD